MLYVREQQRWIELCCGIGGKRAESLCVRIGDKLTQVMLWVSATNYLVRKKWIKSSSDNWKKSLIFTGPGPHGELESWGYLLVCFD